MSVPRRIDLRGGLPDDRVLLPVVEHLQAGGLLAYPTETVYGFGCQLGGEALERLAELKARDSESPFLILVPEVGAVERLVWTREARLLAKVFWPGPLTLLLTDAFNLFPARVRSAEGAVAVRHSAHPLAHRIVELLGEPLTSTSANVRGSPPASDGEAAWAAAVALGAGEELWVLDAGPLPASAASTIVDCTGRSPRVRREGATSVGSLVSVLPHLDAGAGVS